MLPLLAEFISVPAASRSRSGGYTCPLRADLDGLGDLCLAVGGITATRHNVAAVIRVELVQRRGWLVLAHEDVTVDPPRKHGTPLVLHVRSSWHGEDVIEFLEGALLGLGDIVSMPSN